MENDGEHMRVRGKSVNCKITIIVLISNSSAKK